MWTYDAYSDGSSSMPVKCSLVIAVFNMSILLILSIEYVSCIASFL